MTNEILDKLKAFLKLHMPFNEECHAVYLLVEARKLLDREKSTPYPLLRFYADWSVHTAKDRITPQIKTTMECIYRNIMEGVSKGDIRADAILGPFVSMQQLQIEMQDFLKTYGLPMTLIGNGWVPFQSLLARVLVDQPINNPCVGMQRFSFAQGATGSVVGKVVYEREPAAFDTLSFP